MEVLRDIGIRRINLRLRFRILWLSKDTSIVLRVCELSGISITEWIPYRHVELNGPYQFVEDQFSEADECFINITSRNMYFLCLILDNLLL